MSENGNRPRAVIMVPDLLELDLNAKPRTAEHSSENQLTQYKQVA
jgi:hypothetical protein